MLCSIIHSLKSWLSDNFNITSLKFLVVMEDTQLSPPYNETQPSAESSRKTPP